MLSARGVEDDWRLQHNRWFLASNNSSSIRAFCLIFLPLVGMISDMRKALPRDTDKKSVVPLPHPILPEELEW